MAREYYNAMDKSDYAKLPDLIKDSLTTKEIDYTTTFSIEQYIEIMKWDAVFEPEYRILEIMQEENTVKTKISKIDKRILFLHEKPIITREIVRFENDKISSVEIVSYEVFDDGIFSTNRSKLLNWIDANHPELNGFLTDQTEKGGMNYLRALELYQAAN